MDNTGSTDGSALVFVKNATPPSPTHRHRAAALDGHASGRRKDGERTHVGSVRGRDGEDLKVDGPCTNAPTASPKASVSSDLAADPVPPVVSSMEPLHRHIQAGAATDLCPSQ